MKVISILILVIMPLIVFSQTNIVVSELSGILSRSNSPYHIFNDITIPEDQSLIVEPGVVIEFQGHYHLTVYGILKAEGTVADSIYFRAANISDGWSGISLIRDANQYFENDSSIISFSSIENIVSNNAVSENIYLNEYSRLRISNNLIKNNNCSYGIIRCSSTSSPTITNNRLTLNDGPAIYCRESNPLVINNYIIENGYQIPPQNGSGIMLESSSPRIINNIIADNFSDGLGTAIACFYGSFPEISNNTICNNKAVGQYGSTGGICFDEYSNATINNCILWGNTSTLDNYQILYFSGSRFPKTKYCVLEGGKNAISSFPYGNEDLVINEIYVDCYEDNPGLIEDGNFQYELLPSSICINTGNPDTVGMNIPLSDILGNNRFIERIDIGAIEFQGIPENKKPELSNVERLDMIKNSKVQMRIQFEDLNQNDNHTFIIKSSNTNLIIQNFDAEAKYPTYDLIPSTNWTGNGLITVIINDNSGAVNSMDSLTYPVSVQPFACGELTGNTTWDQDTVRVSCDVTVSENSTLTITEGTYIEFQNYSAIKIEGKILALGSLNKPIIFTARDTTGFSNKMSVGWKGIDFYSNTKDTSLLKFCKISYTSTPDYDANVVTDGAALYLDKYKTLDIQNCLFENNKAYGNGGAIYANQSKLKISNSRFQKNLATHGGVGALLFSTLELLNDTLAYNRNYEEGSALYIRNCEVSMNSCFINNNRSDHDNFKSSIDIYQGTLNIYNSIICNNSGGISLDGCNAEILNSLLYYNSNTSIDTWNCIPQIINCIISGELTNAWGAAEISNSIIDRPYIKENNNNYIVDPGFLNPTAGVGIAFDALKADWRLKNNSYAINLGKSETDTTNFSVDIAGNQRISDNRIDIGAYEFQGSPANRKPLINGLEDINVVSESITQLTISYWDPDSTDKHKIEISSSQPNVVIENISQDSMKFTFDLRCVSKWEGTSVINIKVIDNSGSENAVASESFNLVAKNEVCGQIKYNTTWMLDTVFITCNTEIADNVTLSIKPGTHVLFEKNTGLEIVGNLLAIGNQQDSIHFSTVSDNINWNGISIKNGFFAYYHSPDIMNDNDSTILSFCKLENVSSDGLFIDNFSKFVIQNSRICNINGTAIYLYESSPVIKNNLIENCISESGESGTIWAERYSNPQIINNVIRNNKSILGGGINCNYNCNSLITGNLIYNNEANTGGGIYCENSNPKILNNTIVQNNATDGGGIYGKYSSPEIYNSIFWNNTAKSIGNQMNFYDYSPKIKNCLISNQGNDMFFSIQPDIYETVISDDPSFNSNSEFFELSENSLCINTGTNLTPGEYLPNDLLGNSRLIEKLDIGAVEFQGTPAALSPVDFKLSSNYIYENNTLNTFIGKFTTLDPNIEDIFVYNLVKGDGAIDKNNSEFLIINDSLFSNSVFDYESENDKSIYIQVTDKTSNTLNKQFYIKIGNNFEVPLLLNPIPDLYTYVDSLLNFTIPENSFWFEYNDARSYQAFIKGSNELPGWLSFNQYTGTFSGIPYSTDKYDIVVLAKNWSMTSLPDTFLLNVLLYTSNTDLSFSEPLVYPNPATDQIKVSASFPINGITIVDISGRKIYQENLKGINQKTISTKNYSRGIYTVIIKNQNQIFKHKVILH